MEPGNGERAHILFNGSSLSHREAASTLIFCVCILKWIWSNINSVSLAGCNKHLLASYWKKCFVFGKLLRAEHHGVFSSLVIPGLMNELTNERGFACLGLSLRGRLISIQYAKLLRTRDFIQALAPSQRTHWSALRPLGPSLILQDPVVNTLIDSPLQSNKLLNPLARGSGLLYILITINYYHQLWIWFCGPVQMLKCLTMQAHKVKIQPQTKPAI